MGVPEEVDGGARSGAGVPEVEPGCQKWMAEPGVVRGIFIFGKSLSSLKILANYH